MYKSQNTPALKATYHLGQVSWNFWGFPILQLLLSFDNKVMKKTLNGEKYYKKNCLSKISNRNCIRISFNGYLLAHQKLL